MLVPHHTVEEIHPELLNILFTVRQARGFNAHALLTAKVRMINAYFKEHNLSGAVIGVSGGVDSAVALGLLSRASEVAGSPIKKITAVSLPFSVDRGVSNQDIARENAIRVSRAFKVPCACIDLGSTLSELRTSALGATTLQSDAWADGQLAAYLRTPALYYLSALLTCNGMPAIVCGTTNRDEGSYLGFFGKASDGMVDLQIVSDLHKSEVYALGEILGVPTSTLMAAPTGDVFDGRNHLEMIGVPYDFVELYTSWLCLPEKQQERVVESLGPAAEIQFNEWAERVESMHRYNAHKYASGNPSRHLDVLPRAVPGGWRQEGSFTMPSEGKRFLVGEFDLSPRLHILTSNTLRLEPRKSDVRGLDGPAIILDGLLSKHECNALFDAVAEQARLPVGLNGILRDYKEGSTRIGSYRASAYCPELADEWWKRLEQHLPEKRILDQFAVTDWCGHPVWQPVGLNPAMRFIWYESGGELIVHYDAGYDPKDGEHHSLMSLVVYLTDCPPKFGGATRFIRDPQNTAPYSQRDFSDWKRQAEEHEILASKHPVKGRALIFDHRLLHDSQPWFGPEPKVIIRTDIMFRRVQ
jgi:NAD+ synthetase